MRYIEAWQSLNGSGSSSLAKAAAEGPEFQSRLDQAIPYLPNDDAFRHAMVACRFAVRDFRRRKEDPRLWLARLYCLAALSSLLIGRSDHSDELDALMIPEWRARWHVPVKTWEKLRIDYVATGYRDLPLGATDRRWLIAAWGEPMAHTNIRAQNLGVWRAAVASLMRAEYERDTGMSLQRGLTPEQWREQKVGAKQMFDRMNAGGVSDGRMSEPPIIPRRDDARGSVSLPPGAIALALTVLVTVGVLAAVYWVR